MPSYLRSLLAKDMKSKLPILLICVGIALSVLYFFTIQRTPKKVEFVNSNQEIISGSFSPSKLKSESEWKKILTPDEYHILREAGTETPYTGVYNDEKRKGTYYSVGCNIPLFRSETKFDSGTGWPSFWGPISLDSVVLRKEQSGDDRIEVLDRCGGHLGHVFDDGPLPTGKRYCMNSVALRFVPDKE